MRANKQLMKYKNNPIKKFIYDLFAKLTNKHDFSSFLDKNIENIIINIEIFRRSRTNTS